MVRDEIVSRVAPVRDTGSSPQLRTPCVADGPAQECRLAAPPPAKEHRANLQRFRARLLTHRELHISLVRGCHELPDKYRGGGTVAVARWRRYRSPGIAAVGSVSICTRCYARRRDAQRDAGTDHGIVTRVCGARARFVLGRSRLRTEMDTYRLVSMSPLSLRRPRPKKVSAAPHRGEANRPIKMQGEANAAGKQPKSPRSKNPLLIGKRHVENSTERPVPLQNEGLHSRAMAKFG